MIQDEKLARKKSAAYANAKTDEPNHLPYNAIFEDEVDQLYEDVEERLHLTKQANKSKSYFGNTPGVKWAPPINFRV